MSLYPTNTFGAYPAEMLALGGRYYILFADHISILKAMYVVKALQDNIRHV